MSDEKPPTGPKPTLGLTGLTINAMALIAPGAFLWLTYALQSQFGAPVAGQDMWFGIIVALALCFATAISYAELSKLYPGAGSSYFFAEQAFLNKTTHFKFARIAKFITGWASHLYYWVYPGVMVGVTALLAGYLMGQFFPNTFSAGTPSPLFMILFCVVFAFGVSYIAFRGVVGTTGVNMMINIVQITALLIFSFMAISYRMNHKQDDPGWTLDPDGVAINYTLDTFKVNADGKAIDKDNKVIEDDDGNVAAADIPKLISVGGQPKEDEEGNWILVKDDKDKTKDAQDKDGNYSQRTFKVNDDDGLAVDKDGKVIEKDGKIAKADMDKLVDEDAGANKKAKDAAWGANWIGVTVTTKDKDGKEVKSLKPFTVSYKPSDCVQDVFDPQVGKKPVSTFMAHPEASSVTKPHGFGFSFIQACVAILILVGFESVTSMGEEAKNAKRDIPRAVLLSLGIQGIVCYLIEYFAANYFLHNGYTMATARGATAPIGDMMQIVGAHFFGNATSAWWFMIVQAGSVFLALIGTTLSCLSTGARVTYAMGRDEEVPSHFGLLHGRTLTPHAAIWTLATISSVLGIICVYGNFWGGAALADKAIAALPKNAWYSFGLFKHDTAANLPSMMLMMTLVSNFGTFLLYMLTCYTAIVAFRDHHTFSGFKHMFVPIFGVLANFICLLFYLIGPFMVAGMSWKESYCALGVAAIWGVYGLIYFTRSSKAKGKPVLLEKPA